MSVPVLFVVLMLVGFYIKKASTKTVGEVKAAETTVPAQNIDVPTALLTKESGQVLYKLPSEFTFQELNENKINIPTGTTVKTGKDSLAHVIFPDNSLMSLSHNTEVMVNFEDKKINIFQLIGNTWHRVQKVIEGHSYAVETPNTLATVRGTEFNVSVLANKESEVYVKESIVDVSKITKKDGQTIIEQTTRVEQNKHVVVSETKTKKPLEVKVMPVVKKQSTWFQRNKQISEEIKKAEAEIKATGTTSPSATEYDFTELEAANEDLLKHIVIEVMDSLQENEELEKIDVDPTLKKDDGILNEHISVSEMQSENQSDNQNDTGTGGLSRNEETFSQPAEQFTPAYQVTDEPTQPTQDPAPTEEAPQESQEHPTQEPTTEEQPTETPPENTPEP